MPRMKEMRLRDVSEIIANNINLIAVDYFVPEHFYFVNVQYSCTLNYKDNLCYNLFQELGKKGPS
jgi:hypothetical protein